MSSFFIHEQDNFFPSYIFKEIKNSVFSKNTQWSYMENITTGDVKNYSSMMNEIDKNFNNIEDTGAFSVKLKETDETHKKILSDVRSFLLKNCNIKVKEITRGFFVFMPPNPLYKEGFMLNPHVDVTDVSIHNFLLYINDNDAPTIFFNKKHIIGNEYDLSNLNVLKKIEPKQNKAVVFDGSIYHAASVSRLEKRLTLNINFILDCP